MRYCFRSQLVVRLAYVLCGLVALMGAQILHAQDEECNRWCGRAGSWFAGAEAQALRRDSARGAPISAIDLTGFGDPRVVQGTNDLKFDYAVGTRLTLGRWITEQTAWEVVYFGLQSFNAQSAVTDPSGSLLSPFSQFNSFPFGSTVGFDAAHLHQLGYDSQIHNAELNIEHYAFTDSGLAGGLLAGLRLISIDEEFEFRSTSLGTGFNGSDTFGLLREETANVILLGQVGADARVDWSERWATDGKFRAGLGVNFADVDSLFEQQMQVVNRVESGLSNQSVSTLIEAGLGIRYTLGPCWSIRGGYDVMVLSGLLLAPEQFDATSWYFATYVDDTGISVYHGATLGLFGSW